MTTIRVFRRKFAGIALMLALLPLTVSCSSSSGVLKPGPRDEDAPSEFVRTDSGLSYRILRKGNGKKPVASNSVTVHYRGWLDNNFVFDSSYKRGEPISFALDGVIDGWTEGMTYVSEGGMIELIIPPDLGYGVHGSPPSIPGQSTLYFLVELLEVK